MMKKLKYIIMAVLIIACTSVTVNAKPITFSPTAGIYKEGIYHFSKCLGNKVSLKLTTPEENIIMMIIKNEDGVLKYFVNFGETCKAVDIFLELPVEKYTVILIGEGEIAFTFEN
ncbi:MAG: hypothetical protein SO128_14810 [Clostridium cadaveris]|uniref:DUF3244 domain-containing protein n=1 Tax=Clostridium cadaveris TaxID=1529 RepID=A0A316M5A8_9CLOT|nr:hypothetical protein [Clostridium cadaveris]MDY4950626.1 hypothetical protein [Clostridium cadaveris]NME65487.1 hypothetical protein [Clostridium cadaveris]NWK11941.1 hypothetical protein [Clostridium cadaveris]PWL53672.1 MAG: hypothetical protein DBY38_06760 [Clostridium cadaveris]